MPIPSLISLRHIEKSFANGAERFFVLRNISLDVAPGDFVSVMGPSGAGKSTLLHLLGMHDSDWRGEYYFNGEPVHALRPKDRPKFHKQHFGFVFQSYHLLDNLTVYENLDVPLSYRDIPRSQRRVWWPIRSTGSGSWARRICIPVSSRGVSSSWSASRAR
jgi:ABC-type lipoprotein export system ATPase subunit